VTAGALAPTLDALCGGQDLEARAAEALFAALAEGRFGDAGLGALVVALKAKGETGDELAGAARALRAAARPFPRPSGDFADVCGTGGDGASSWNISTGVAFVVASCGLPVLKHGGGAVSSRSGSMDVLRALGLPVDASPEATRASFDAIGIGFVDAAAYHPALARVRGVRRALGVRTVFNLLGPLVHPAAPPIQLLGVAHPSLLRPMAETLVALGVRRGLVVHGAGLDELGLHAPSVALRIGPPKATTTPDLDAHPTIETLEIDPAALGLPRTPRKALRVGSVDASLERLTAALAGQGTPGDQGILALNAGALLWSAGRAGTLPEGVALARDALLGGRPAALLDRAREVGRAA